MSVLAEPTVAPKNPRNTPFQGSGDRDISQSAWQNWQAPVGTVDPERLIPSDSTDSPEDAVPEYRFDSFKSDSFQSANSVKEGKPIQVEASKPIKIEAESTVSVSQPAAVLATTVRKPTGSSKRITVVAILGVAAFAYRKFRRAHAGPHPPKPSFL